MSHGNNTPRLKTLKILIQGNPSRLSNHRHLNTKIPILFKTVNKVAQAIDPQSDNQDMTFSFD